MSDLENRVKRALRTEAEAGGFRPSLVAWQEVVERAQGTAGRAGQARREPAKALLFAITSVIAVVAIVAGIVFEAERDMGYAQAGPDGLGQLLPAMPAACEALEHPIDVVDPGDVDELRFIPTSLPSGSDTILSTFPDPGTPCGQLRDVEPALSAWSKTEDGMVDGVITLYGPFRPVQLAPDPGAYDSNRPYTRVRGTLAQIEVEPHGLFEEVQITWTEASTTTWVLVGSGVDEPTLREVAEALTLDSTPSVNAAPAELAKDGLPLGYQLTWTAESAVSSVRSDRRRWVVQSNECEISFELSPLRVAPVSLLAKAGERLVSVGAGAHGVASATGQLTWETAPGVIGSVDCGPDHQAAVQVAESVVHVAVDDRRLRLPTSTPAS